MQRDLGEAAAQVRPLHGGQVGRVSRVDTDGGRYVVKLVEGLADPPFADEPVDVRVYGNRFGNLAAAYARLVDARVPTPKLHSHGALPDAGLRYGVFDYLDGDPDDASPAWFAAVGAALRRLHAVTRAYQGWVGMDAPLAEAWPSAFLRTLAIHFAMAAPHLPAPLRALAERAVEGAELDAPATFVLSHTDGFQAVMARDGAAWRLVGHYDVEDFQFTDPRMVLAGFALNHELAGRAVPPAFWEAYGPPPPDLEARAPLFQLHYLLVWTRVLRRDPAGFATCLAGLERLLGGS